VPPSLTRVIEHHSSQALTASVEDSYAQRKSRITIASVVPSSLDVLDCPEFGTKLPIEELLDRFPETRGLIHPQALAATMPQFGIVDWRSL